MSDLLGVKARRRLVKSDVSPGLTGKLHRKLIGWKVERVAEFRCR